MRFNLLYRNLSLPNDKKSRYHSYVHQWNEVVHIVNECSKSAFPDLKTENIMENLGEIENIFRRVVKREGLKDEIESILPFKGVYYGR